MAAKPKADVGAIAKALLSSPLTRRIAGPILEAVLPKVRAKVGRRPLLAIGAGAAGVAAGVQYLVGRGETIPDKIAQPIGIGVMLAGILVGQKAVTPVAQPRLTAAQKAKAVILPGPKKKG